MLILKWGSPFLTHAQPTAVIRDDIYEQIRYMKHLYVSLMRQQINIQVVTKYTETISITYHHDQTCCRRYILFMLIRRNTDTQTNSVAAAH